MNMLDASKAAAESLTAAFQKLAPPPGERDDKLLWGAKAIGAAINQTKRQTDYLLQNKLIRCAGQKGNKWFAPRKALRREFGLEH
jgi:hypothetical protein